MTPACTVKQEQVSRLKSIGEKIRQIRIRRGMTQTELASGIVSPSMISQIEAGKARASYALLCSLAARLATPVEYFLSDLEEPFTHTTKLRLAEYHLLLQEPDKAIELLEPLLPATSTDPSEVRAHETELGINMAELQLLLTRAYRLTGQIRRAIHLLETARELTMRAQDPRLNFFLAKESGHLEYATRNLEGAIHEWRRAVRFGEILLNSDPSTGSQVRRELAEVCLGLWNALQHRSQLDEARSFLERAVELTRDFTGLKAVAEAMIADGRQALKSGDAAQAKVLVDRAVSVIEAVHGLGLALLARSRAWRDVNVDAWDRAAEALFSSDVRTFVEAELVRADRALAAGDWQTAERRVRRCSDILADYRDELGVDASELRSLELRLNLTAADVAYHRGDVDDALERIATFVEQLDPVRERLWMLRAVSRQLEWYGELGREEDVKRILERIAQSAAPAPKIVLP
jgi:transcriptional regulator with XRE-family HTH domain